ncbi:MAG: sodium/proton-translocating pyrophosphatase, partial [Bacteroidota bacterium]
MELTLIFACSVIGLLFAIYLTRDVMKRDVGTERMREISDAIKTGAEAFLRRQYGTIVLLALALAALIYILYAVVRTPTEHDPASPLSLAFWTTLSFVFGAACSIAAGYMGMWVSIRSNIRTAAEATKGINGALQTALRGGAVSGFFVVAMSLLGVGGLFAIVNSFDVVKDVSKIPLLIVGYGFGAS